MILPGSYQEFTVFIAVLMRVSIFIFLFPFFGARLIPARAKAGLSLLISLLLFPQMDPKTFLFVSRFSGLVRLLLSELVTGMILGLMVSFFFEGIKIMGQVVGFQTGFSITNVIDPQSLSQVSILANMAYFMSIVIFLAMNGHHLFLAALHESFELIPPGSVLISRDLFILVKEKAGEMFVIAIKTGSPAIAALLLVQVVFGLVTKLIPQMNIMIVAFPVQIAVGLIFFGLSLLMVKGFIQNFAKGLFTFLTGAMKLMG